MTVRTLQEIASLVKQTLTSAEIIAVVKKILKQNLNVKFEFCFWDKHTGGFSRGNKKNNFQNLIKKTEKLISESQYIVDVNDENKTAVLTEINNEIIGLCCYENTQSIETENLICLSNIVALKIFASADIEGKSERRELTPSSAATELIKNGAHKTVNEIMASVINLVSQSFPYERCSVFLTDNINNKLILLATRPETKEKNIEMNINDDPLIKELITTKKGIIINDINKSRIVEDIKSAHTSIRSFMSVPIIVSEEVIGTINLSNTTPDIYTDKHFERLSLIAAQTGVICYTANQLLNLDTLNQNIIESVNVGIIYINEKKENFLINSFAKKILKLKKGFKFGTLIKHLTKFNLKAIKKTLLKEKEYAAKIMFEKNSAEQFYEIRASKIKNNFGVFIGYAIIIEDRTSEYNMDRYLKQTERLAALGEFAAGVAHEIKNPLTAIKGFTQLLPTKIDNKIFREKFMKVITREVTRVNEIIENLLLFARPNKETYTKLCLNEILANVIDLFSSQMIKNNIDIDFNAKRKYYSYGDGNALKQVFVNLALNGMQAMPKGGKFTINLKEVQKTNKIMIEFKDTGEGIHKELVNKIFNPFFTTKEKGTGLGLAISYRIIEEHKGEIKLKSSLRKGTVFKVFLKGIKDET